MYIYVHRGNYILSPNLGEVTAYLSLFSRLSLLSSLVLLFIELEGKMDDEVGNRFYPSDQQIILHYLEGKMNGFNFPNVIEEIDICKFEPRDLPG